MTCWANFLISRTARGARRLKELYERAHENKAGGEQQHSRPTGNVALASVHVHAVQALVQVDGELASHHIDARSALLAVLRHDGLVDTAGAAGNGRTTHTTSHTGDTTTGQEWRAVS